MWWVNPSLGPSGFLLSILLLPTKDHFAIIRVHSIFLFKSQQRNMCLMPFNENWKAFSCIILVIYFDCTDVLYQWACIHSRICLFEIPWTVTPKFLCLWDFFSGKNTRMGCHFLLQEVFPTQGSNPGLLYLLYGQVDSLPLSHLRSQYYILNMLWGLPLWSSGKDSALPLQGAQI